MKKALLFTIVAMSIVLGVGIGLSTNPFRDSMKRETTKRFVPILKEMSQNPAECENFSAIIAGLTPLVAEQSKKNPEMFSPFIQDMVEATVKSSPGSAIKFEDYATSQTKHDIEQIRQNHTADSNKITGMEKQIADLNAQIEGASKEKDDLEAVVVDSKKLLTDQQEEIRQGEIKRDSLNQQIAERDRIIAEFRKASVPTQVVVQKPESATTPISLIGSSRQKFQDERDAFENERRAFMAVREGTARPSMTPPARESEVQTQIKQAREDIQAAQQLIDDFNQGRLIKKQ